jgi:hypothetical protein
VTAAAPAHASVSPRLARAGNIASRTAVYTQAIACPEPWRTLLRRWLAVGCLAALPILVTAQSPPAHETDLDRFMAAVLSRRDENWKKLQQYILDERERIEVVGPDRLRLYALNRDYRWFVKDGFFIRSPLTSNGVAIGEDERRRYETHWLEEQRARDKRRRERDEKAGKPAPPADPQTVGDVLRQQAEPSFVSAAYFLRFRFDAGHYALAGKETLNGRDVLRIEYYPTRLFDDDADDRTRSERRAEQARRSKDDDMDARIERQMNKVSLVTLWILREPQQIVRYTFDNIDMGFLPGRSLLRVDELKASMTMSEPFAGVWLPKGVEAEMAFDTALGRLGARYDIAYTDYKEAGVTVKVR